MTVTVTFTLASGSLVVGPTPGVGNMWISGEGVTLPSFSHRIRYAPESDVHPGRVRLAYTTDSGDLVLPIYAQASSAANLATLQANLAAAAAYPGAITVLRDGVSYSYTDRQPAAPAPWEQDEGMRRVHLARTTVVVPVNPA
jgi:hypothetical protein